MHEYTAIELYVRSIMFVKWMCSTTKFVKHIYDAIYLRICVYKEIDSKKYLEIRYVLYIFIYIHIHISNIVFTLLSTLVYNLYIAVQTFRSYLKS